MLNLSLRRLFNKQSLILLHNLSKNTQTINTRCLSISHNPKFVTKENGGDQKPNEQEFLVRIKADPDVFGSSVQVEDDVVDEGDVKEHEYIEFKPSTRKLSTKQYADLIKQFIREHRIKEAIDVVEVQMLQTDKVKPESYLYNLLIGACGRVGYTKKAFSLYNEMKRRGLQIHPGTYTGLFNACANSPWKEDGLKRAKHLHNIMIEKRYTPNDSNYNAMIKAYGHCGDLQSAFAIVDEMQMKSLQIKDDTMNFLLQACIEDKEAGFRHALLVWRKMMEKRIKPSIFTYNLMLRCIRDCGLGDLEATQDVIKQILPPDDRFLRLEPPNSDDASTTSIPPNSELRPNLMLAKPHLGNIIELSEITEPEHRLLLVGGAKGFLTSMNNFECPPNIKTFTQLLECIPSTQISEKEIITIMSKNGVKPDLGFYNMLIKRRAMRSDYEGARVILEMIKMKDRPDLITYGVMALACKNRDEATELVDEMRQAKYRLNVEIIGAMLKQACWHKDFPYVLMLMELLLEEKIPANEMLLNHLKKFIDACNKIISEKSLKTYSQNQKFYKNFMIFKMRYKTWKNEVQVAEEEHPFEQFRTSNEAPKYFKNKSMDNRFKARHLSLYRVKTSSKHGTKNTKNAAKIVKVVGRKYKPRKTFDNKKDVVDYKETLSLNGEEGKS